MQFAQHHLWLNQDPIEELRAQRSALVAEGRSLVDLSMINPDLVPPRLLLDRLMEASSKGANHRYAVSRGVRKLREAFAAKYARRFNVTLDPESEVCVTMGTKEAVANVLHVICGPGDGVLLGTPTYPVYLSAIRLAQLNPTFFSLQLNEHAMLEDITNCLRRGVIRLILLNFPNNPTGHSVSAAFFSKLLERAKQYGAFVLNDFVYGEMCFAEQAPSLLSVSTDRELVAETYSLSKGYNVPGWRVAALLGSPSLIKSVARLKSFTDYGLFLPLQFAAAAALSAKEDLVATTVRTYERRLRAMLPTLISKGFQVSMPAAGASLWIKLPAGTSALDYAQDLLRREGVVVMAGDLFGREYTEYVRLAAVVPEEILREVSARMSLKEPHEK